MKNKKDSHLHHKEYIEQKLQPWLSLRQDLKPDSGWIKAIRMALGMTTKQLANLMGIAQPNIMAIEEREVRQAITLETLEKAAQAMDCKLIYAIIPKGEWLKLRDDSASVTTVLKQESLSSNEDHDWVSLLQKNLRNPQ